MHEELFLGRTYTMDDMLPTDYVPDDDFLAGVNRKMPQELVSEFDDNEDDREPIQQPVVQPIPQPQISVPGASNDAFRGASWAYVRDPRACLLPRDDPSEILPGQSRIGYTRFFLDPGARQALFDRSDDALLRMAKISVGLFLESIGCRNTMGATGFYEIWSKGIKGTGETPILPIHLRHFDVDGTNVAYLRPSLVQEIMRRAQQGMTRMAFPENAVVVHDLQRILGVVQLGRFDVTEPIVWMIANVVDRAIRVAYMVEKYVPNQKNRVLVENLHSNTANLLSKRTQKYHFPVLTPIQATDSLIQIGKGLKQHVLAMPLSKFRNVPDDFYFSDDLAMSSIQDPVEKVLRQLTHYAGYIGDHPPLQPIVVNERVSKLRFAFNPPMPSEVSSDDPTVYLGELTRPVFEMPMDNENAVFLGPLQRKRPISTRVGYTIGEDTDPNTIFEHVIFARWPIFAFIDAVHDLLQSADATVQTWNDVHFRFHDWYNAQWTIRERPPTYLYLMPAGLVRAILHSGRGVMRTAAADCLLALALGEYSLRPSVVAANLVEEICMLCASMQHAEYDFTYYLPARIASPSAFLSILELRKLAVELESEYIITIDPERIEALLDAETRMIVAATIAMAYGRLLRTWRDSMKDALRAAAMRSPKRGDITSRAGKLTTALQILDGLIEHTLSDISPAKFRLLNISTADEETIRNSGGSNVTDQIGKETVFARARFLYEIMAATTEWHFEQDEQSVLGKSPYLSTYILKELRKTQY